MDLETSRFVLRPEEGDPQVFIYRPDSFEISSGDQQVEPDALQDRPQAEVNFVVSENDKNIARSVQLQESESRTQTVTGTVVRVDLETSRFVLRPEEGDPQVFIYRPDSFEISSGDQQVEPDALQDRPQAEVNFVVSENDKNIARSVQLQESATTQEATGQRFA